MAYQYESACQKYRGEIVSMLWPNTYNKNISQWQNDYLSFHYYSSEVLIVYNHDIIKMTAIVIFYL